MSNGGRALTMAVSQQLQEINRKKVSFAMLGRARPDLFQSGPIPIFIPIKCPETGDEREVELHFSADFHRGMVLSVGLFRIVAYRVWEPAKMHGLGRRCPVGNVELLKQFVLEVLRHNRYLDSDFRYPSMSLVMKQHAEAKKKMAEACTAANQRVMPNAAVRGLIYGCRPKKLDCETFMAKRRRLMSERDAEL
jgi:hypothetical protein